LNRLQELTKAIAENTVPGGSAFGRAAAEVILLTITNDPELDGKRLIEKLDSTTEWLVATKPSMTSVRTVSDLALSAVTSGGRAGVISAMRAFMAESVAAIASIANHADAFFPAGTTALFHSYSGSLIQILTRAAELHDYGSVVRTHQGNLSGTHFGCFGVSGAI
jgi:translation initiation factor 2B subunit (eIF-2B alpha/beta/delta family)